MPNRPPRLDRIFASYEPPLYFVTFNILGRRKLLATASVHARFIAFADKARQRDVCIGRYVLMPDHIHLFIQGNSEFVLSQWIRMLKRDLSKAISGAQPHWQSGFFDHLIRHHESYAQKWEYVRLNPVRAKLAEDSAAWPFQGEIVAILM